MIGADNQIIHDVDNRTLYVGNETVRVDTHTVRADNQTVHDVDNHTVCADNQHNADNHTISADNQTVHVDNRNASLTCCVTLHAHCED